jgi:hypothetical protein
MPGQAHVKITMSGHFGPVASPWEIWTAGFAMDALDAGDQAEVASSVSGAFASPASHVATYVWLDDVAIAYNGANHRQIGETVHIPQAGVHGGGQDGATPMPSQVALRVSLDSGLRGRSQKGGFYLPTPSAGIVNTTGLMSDSVAAEVAATWAQLFTHLNDVTSGLVVVPSSVVGNVHVTRVRVGRALDTIRRRRNGLAEAYQQATV